ncbi:S-adenosyl-L-methionine-dependent methyltransferase [Dactylonectria macrodidyma]|uniref:S-adenosyl-L-methionine-dependent methyltransferase n=1 Tax=Dactylonectria macrodidyma TaxID=307937 RepID=A0A9P9DP41_9HYPO|nr:S-adenosyl-L-methionine-dependent methyltransferase [Dactylonectria macrodidyma]
MSSFALDINKLFASLPPLPLPTDPPAEGIECLDASPFFDSEGFDEEMRRLDTGDDVEPDFSHFNATGRLWSVDRFNAEAKAWDDNPFVLAMSLEAWKAIQRAVPALSARAAPGGSSNRLDVLEIGCGTGLLSLQVAPAVNRVVAVDAAEGMIEVLSYKLNKRLTPLPENITPLAILLEDPEDKRMPPADEANPDGPRLKYDLIISHLVLHHIPDVASVLKTMLGCLKPGGMVALTDFENFGPEARRFHPEAKMKSVEHHGIGREWIAGLMKEAGFEDVGVSVAWKHTRVVEGLPGEFLGGEEGGVPGKLMTFPYIICLGKRGGVREVTKKFQTMSV